MPLLTRLLQLLHRRRLYGDVSDEIEEHLAEKIDSLIAGGISPRDAAAAARREFGNVALLAESSREAWGWGALERLGQDARYGLRTARRNPAFMVSAVLILALGIGANTAIFSVVDAVLLRPLPYKDPSRLVRVATFNRPLGVHAGPASFLDFTDWHRAGIFEEVALYGIGNSILQVGQTSERVTSGTASATFFPLLGVQPLIGRVPLPEEGRPSHSPVAMLGEDLWRRDFAADPAIVGRTVRLDGMAVLVVGILPAGFQFEDNPALWTSFELSDNLVARGNRYLHAIARLHPGQTVTQADSRLAAICGELAARFPASNHDWSAQSVPMLEAVVGPVRRQLVVLMAAVGLVLLICCGNVAMLFLVRGAGRLRELGLRAALGASRARILTQLLMESALISLLGGAAGVALATGLVSLLLNHAPPQIPRLSEVHVDWRVLLVALALSLLTTVVFGMGPALELSRPDPKGLLREGGRTTTAGKRRRLLGGFLLAGETALSLVLLVGAALLVKSFVRLNNVDPGFRTDHLLTFHLPMPTSKFMDGQKYMEGAVTRYFNQVIDELERLPQVESAGAAMGLPLGGGGWQPWQGFAIPGHPDTAIHKTIAVVMPVTLHYFHTMGISLATGRMFDSGDTEQAPRVAMINQTMAGKYFAAQSPLGQAILVEGDKTPVRIVGVVGSVKPDTLDSGTFPEIYLPYAQRPAPFMAVVVRTRVDPLSLSPVIEKQLLRLDRDIPPYQIRSAEQLLARSLAERRFAMSLMVCFAGVALMLALVGLYGVISYSVAQLTRDIGIRMALGAGTRDVLTLVLRQSLSVALGGIVAGLALSVGLTRLLAGLLFEVKPLDPAVLALMPLGLAAVSVLACAVPARRAARVDPTVALRYE